MPPSGFSQKAIAGVLQFIGSCYEDLLAEVAAGKHPDFETAIKFEISQIGKALEQLHIDQQGKLVDRVPSQISNQADQTGSDSQN